MDYYQPEIQEVQFIIQDEAGDIYNIDDYIVCIVEDDQTECPEEYTEPNSWVESWDSEYKEKAQIFWDIYTKTSLDTSEEDIDTLFTRYIDGDLTFNQ